MDSIESGIEYKEYLMFSFSHKVVLDLVVNKIAYDIKYVKEKIYFKVLGKY